MTAITGPSGCGKCTLLYCLSGLEEPTGGEVRVLGENLQEMNQRELALFRRSHVGFVFQAYNLVPSMTVWDNIMFPITLAGRRVDHRAVSELIDEFLLKGHERDAAGSLSGGEQQRVALLRTLLSDPDIVFADEPTGALDQRRGRMVFEKLQAFAHHPRKCLVMVTHDPHLAEQCDFIYTMRDG